MTEPIKLTAADLQRAASLQRILHELALYVERFETKLRSGDMTWTWKYDEEGQQVQLTVTNKWEENTACHCHPEYEHRERESTYWIPVEQLDETDLSAARRIIHNRFNENLNEEKAELERKANLARLAEEAEAERKRIENEKRERQTYDRLRQKFGSQT
jgi:hypothetical protein